MCGIAGIISSDGVRANSIIKMTEIVRHRGPDDEGYVIFRDLDKPPTILGGSDTPDDVYASELQYKPEDTIHKFSDTVCQLAFGHRRLSILDLSPAGHLPMCDSTKRYWITYNGEIYNFIELREELINKGYSFETQTDTEVILIAYKEWGSNCLHHFNGMWAFAIYDSVEKSIFLARDRFGIKPLYYWFGEQNFLAFASEIKQFTVLPGWKASLDYTRAADYLVHSFTDHSDETMFKGVYQLRPGEYVKFLINSLQTNLTDKLNTTQWYELAYKPFEGDFNQAASIFSNLFSDAVKLHLRADVPVGSALSGGLDSSAIVCEINRLLRQSGDQELQKTFSSCSVYEQYDEKEWMDEVIKHVAVDAHFIYPKLEDLFKHTPQLVWQHDEPYQSQSAYLGWHVFKLAKENGVTVLLNGQGADEYLGGYGQFTDIRQFNLSRSLKISELYKEINANTTYRGLKGLSQIKSILNLYVPLYIKDYLRERNGGINSIKSLLRLPQNIYKHPLNNIMYKTGTVPEISELFTLYSPLPKYLRWEDRNSMAHSIEARVPFLDYRLVEFTRSLPDNFLEYMGVTKRVMREGLSDLLPSKIKNRHDKKGFITPEEQWVKYDNPDLFRKKLKESIEVTNGLISPDAIPYFEKVLNSEMAFDYTYWRFILFAEWVKKFQIDLSSN